MGYTTLEEPVSSSSAMDSSSSTSETNLSSYSLSAMSMLSGSLGLWVPVSQWETTICVVGGVNSDPSSRCDSPRPILRMNRSIDSNTLYLLLFYWNISHSLFVLEPCF
nr:MAG TPA: hypothetical protein [Caudoviricetes sp.]